MCNHSYDACILGYDKVNVLVICLLACQLMGGCLGCCTGYLSLHVLHREDAESAVNKGVKRVYGMDQGAGKGILTSTL